MTEKLDAWMFGYRRAWESNDPAEIGALFTTNAAYYYEPYAPPVRGREAIVASWLQNADPAGSTSFSWSPLVVTRELAIVQGETAYPDRRYSNLWVIRLDEDGRASEFTEWWMKQTQSSGE